MTGARFSALEEPFIHTIIRQLISYITDHNQGETEGKGERTEALPKSRSLSPKLSLRISRYTEEMDPAGGDDVLKPHFIFHFLFKKIEREEP